MNAAKISATEDVDQAVLTELESLIAIDLPVKLDECRTFLRSAEPPSWISFIAQSDWWVKGLAAYAALYLAEIVKEAAKDTWKNKGKAETAVIGTSNKLWRFASSLFQAKLKSRANTYITIGLPIPDDTYTTLLRSQSTDADDLAVEVALFVLHVPALVQLLNHARIPEGSALGWVSAELLPNGSLQVKWMDKETLEVRLHVLPFQP